MSFGTGLMFPVNTLLATIYKGCRKIEVGPNSPPVPAPSFTLSALPCQFITSYP